MDLGQIIREKAHELLASKKVECVMGYERATDGKTARPLFAYTPEETDRFIFDETCVHGLAKFLLSWKDKSTAIVAKPCDVRSVNLLIQEKQLKRDKVFIMGVVCPGVAECSWDRVGPPQQRCNACPQHNPPVYDFLVGQPVEEKAPQNGVSPEVARIKAMSAAERRAFWNQQFERCVRCYACRQACPGCYCTECFVDQLDPTWVGIRHSPADNHMWNTVRAFHLAGRCTQCGECQRVCPGNIPLMLVNDELTQEVGEKFAFRPGMDPSTLPPFATFKKDEHLGIG